MSLKIIRRSVTLGIAAFALAAVISGTPPAIRGRNPAERVL